MADRHARDKALEILNSLEAGLTNWKLEDEWPRSDSDAALNCILRWLWTTYDDAKEVWLCDVFSAEDRSILKKTMDFLASDVEFEERQLSSEEAREERRKWGREWRLECTLPDYPEWPFPRNYSSKQGV